MKDGQEKYAFPGLHYFQDDPVDRQLFFARESETKELTDKILAHTITVLFGRSGDGKTSLINAGVKEALRQAGYLPVRARVFNHTGMIPPREALYDAIQRDANRQGVTLPGKWRRPTLWETFYGLRPTRENGLKPIVLILDQFEEFFTVFSSDAKAQTEFLAQFADLVRGRLPNKVRNRMRSRLSELEAGSQEALQIERLIYGPAGTGVRVLLSLREDYLAFLDNLGDRIPLVYASRYRLPSLTVEAARDAITKPPRQEVLGERKFQIQPEAVDSMLRFLTEGSSATGRSEKVVGPPQLQILCRQLEERMRAKGRVEIRQRDLGGEKGMREMLSRYYWGICRNFPLIRLGKGPRRARGLAWLVRWLFPFHFPRLSVRVLCEDRLITSGGNRNSRHEEEIVKEVGVALEDLEALVNTRLLRREPRLKGSFYELSHDSLVRSLQANATRRRRSTMLTKMLAVLLLTLAVLQWGFPRARNYFVLRELQADFNDLSSGKVDIAPFRYQLRKAQEYAPRSKKYLRIKSEFDEWRLDQLQTEVLKWTSPHLDRADSVLRVLRKEYPSADSVIVELQDSLSERRIRQVLGEFEALVAGTAGEEDMPTDQILVTAEKLLDNAYYEFPLDTRIDSLRENLEGLKGNVDQQQVIREDRQRKSRIVSSQLRGAIVLVRPRGTVVRGDSADGTVRTSVQLRATKLLANATIRIDGRVARKKWTGYLEVPPDVPTVVLNITASSKGTKAERKITYQVDRQPPSLLQHTFYCAEGRDQDFKPMPPEEWKGDRWMLAGYSTERLQKVMARGMGKTAGGEVVSIYRNGELDKKGNGFTISGTIQDLAGMEVVSWSVSLTDLAGWQRTLELGEWRLLQSEMSQHQGPGPPPLRADPRELTMDEVKALVAKLGFYAAKLNPGGKGYGNDFREARLAGWKVVVDQATRLMWQAGGSAESMSKDGADTFIAQLNGARFAGFSDWRLPTLEEALSLCEREKQPGGLNINQVFDGTQEWVWTADAIRPRVEGSANRWVVGYLVGDLGYANITKAFVRAVRSLAAPGAQQAAK